MNKRYHARWNIISYIKIHFNRLRQLFSPFLLPHIFSLLWGSLSSLFWAFVFLLLRKLWISFVFVLNLLHFFPTSLYPSFYLCLPHPPSTSLYESWMHSMMCTFYRESFFLLWQFFWHITSVLNLLRLYIISCVHITELIFIFITILHAWKAVIELHCKKLHFFREHVHPYFFFLHRVSHTHLCPTT